MKFKRFILMAIVAVIPASAAFADFPSDTTSGRSYWWSGGAFDPVLKWARSIDNLVIGPKGTGDIFYVDSGVLSEGDGTSWIDAKDTLDEAINLCTANQGDIIYVAQGHAETIAAANGFDGDVAGITIIGIGNGAMAPTFTYSATGSTAAIGAANVTFCNLRFLAGISEVVTGISVEATADDCAIINCTFPEPTTSTFEFDKAIVVAAGADRLTVRGCTQYTADATGATNFLDLDAGVQNGTRVIGNRLYGEYAEGAIHSDDIDLECYVAYNTISNITSGQHAIEFTAAATGVCEYNRMYTDDETISLDPGSMMCIENYITTAIDTSATIVPTRDDTQYNLFGVDNANNAAATSNVAANATGTMLERLQQLQEYLDATDTKAGHTYATTKAATVQSDDLFDVAGGAILITSFVGVVTTGVQAQSTILEINLDADAGWVDHDFSTAVELNADAAGTRYVFSNANESVLTPLEGADAGATILMSGWYCGEGMIEQYSAQTSTGNVTWYMTWIPYADGTTVTAQ